MSVTYEKTICMAYMSVKLNFTRGAGCSFYDKNDVQSKNFTTT